MHHENHPDHTRHDVTLIAGHAAGDLPDSERIHAESLLSTCSPCADLHRDLLAIATATRSLPAPATAGRDFRLAPEQAARLRRGSWLRAALRPFATTRSAARPMAAAFTSLGIAGLLVATILPGLFGSAAAPSSERTTAAGPGSSSAPAQAPVTPLGGNPGAAGAPTPGGDQYNVDANSGAPEGTAADNNNAGQSSDPKAVAIGGTGTESGGNQAATERLSEASPPNLVLIGSLALLAVGLFLFGLRVVARRLS